MATYTFLLRKESTFISWFIHSILRKTSQGLFELVYVDILFKIFFFFKKKECSFWVYAQEW